MHIAQRLGRGLRTVLLLILPAAVGLWLLGEPITRLIFEHGRFQSTDTIQVVSALNIYLVGMLFAAIDFPLNYAFYARNNTMGPALVGVFSVAAYVLIAFALLDGLGYRGLIWADSAKQATHALVMLLLLTWRVGRLRRGDHTQRTGDSGGGAGHDGHNLHGAHIPPTATAP